MARWHGPGGRRDGGDDVDDLQKDGAEIFVLASYNVRGVMEPEEVEKKNDEGEGERTSQETVVGKDEEIGVGMKVQRWQR